MTVVYMWPHRVNRFLNIKNSFAATRGLCHHLGVTDVSLAGRSPDDDQLIVRQTGPELLGEVVHSLTFTTSDRFPFHPVRLSSVFAATGERVQPDVRVGFRGVQWALEQRIVAASTAGLAIGAG